MTQILSAALAGIVAGLVLAVGHYAIDRIRRGRPLPRLAAYVYGTLTINLIFSVWLLLEAPPPGAAVLGLWIIIAAAGAADIGCYALDAYLEAEAARREAALLRERLDEAHRQRGD